MLGASYGILRAVASQKNKKNEVLNKDNQYLNAKEVKAVPEKKNFYEKHGKKAIDSALSFCGLAALAPVYGVLAAAIYIDDPGPVLFTQKRVGENKRFFSLHKFRSMKMSTPHDTPTHLLDNPDQYITRVGRILRKYSLDELPQIWDIFAGNMSIIGPRPALWNQDDLVAERDLYGANDVVPGLTGWAQINGRDELEIPVKAKFDGDYVKALKESSLSGFKMDVKCFFGTITSVLKHEGVVEGGTGEMKKNETKRDSVPENDPPSVYGCDKNVIIDELSNKSVLITGAGSFIGDSLCQFAKVHYPNIRFESCDMVGDYWREKDFSPYDAVFHVAGIAHADVRNVSEKDKERYYKINTDLAIQTALKAKADGVKQFIFMSSMIIYGQQSHINGDPVITRDTVPNPDNFYGDSKWLADKAIRAIEDENFKVAVVRPPMVYGPGCKGNYNSLSEFAKKTPVFPDVKNERSMIYIENLCSFLCKLILSGENGIWFPQNDEYVSTENMVHEIANVYGKSIFRSHLLSSAVAVGTKIPGKTGIVFQKAFGNNTYDKELSHYSFDYCVTDFPESIYCTENNIRPGSEKRILIVTSVASMIDQFIKQNIPLYQSLDYSVDVAANFTQPGNITAKKAQDLKNELKNQGVRVFDIPVPRSLNPKLIKKSYEDLKKIIKTNHYLIVHCHSPIGGVIARMAAAPFRNEGLKVIYTAHGFHFYEGAPAKNWAAFYPVEKALSKVTDVLITINTEDYDFAVKHLDAAQTEYLPGIGIDLTKFNNDGFNRKQIREELGISEDDVMLLSVGELNENKNHQIVIKALHEINNSKFHYFIAGKGELGPELEKEAESAGVNLHLLGYRTDISALLHACDLFILPSIREGLNVSLMEAMAAGVPCICSDIRGNRDLIDDSSGGYLESPFDKATWKNGILNALSQPKEKYRKYNQHKIEGFSLSVVNEKLTSIIKGISKYE